jgi:hypothetical protein
MMLFHIKYGNSYRSVQHNDIRHCHILDFNLGMFRKIVKKLQWLTQRSEVLTAVKMLMVIFWVVICVDL